jgi:uncharacterized Zn-finger protein
MSSHTYLRLACGSCAVLAKKEGGSRLSSRHDWTSPKPKWEKKLDIVKYPERVPCPYCPANAPTFPSNLSLARHVLTHHNWDKSKERVALTRDHLLELIRKHLGSKSTSYPDDTYTVKKFEALADEIAEAFA